MHGNESVALLDLFSGMGGLAFGFARSGFSVTGYDIHPRVPGIFEINRIGRAVVADLNAPGAIHAEDLKVRVITGGPPCKPWSALNIHRRGANHPDYKLLHVFFQVLHEVYPEAFLMENVPRLARDPAFVQHIKNLRAHGYDVEYRVVRYSDFGAATSRRRLILVGFRISHLRKERAERFFQLLDKFRRPPLPVRRVLDPLLNRSPEEDPDHVWPAFKTVDKYRDKYKTGRFGWYQLDPDLPAPSFGNIKKTYILHPYAGNGKGVPLRVLSIREAMAIMGFPDDFRFPQGMGMNPRYQMVADAVSPVFSKICARVIRELLN